MLGWRSLEALSARLAQYGFERSRPRSRELQLDQSRKGAASSAPVKSYAGPAGGLQRRLLISKSMEPSASQGGK